MTNWFPNRIFHQALKTYEALKLDRVGPVDSRSDTTISKNKKRRKKQKQKQKHGTLDQKPVM